jgi:hypothetical protein
MLELQISEGAVQMSVWDSDPALPDVAASDPQRVGRHGPSARRTRYAANRSANASQP